MHSQSNTVSIYVNSRPTKPLNIWDRFFDKEIAALGKANGKYIDVYKELRRALGRSYEYVAACIELSRRFGYGFHLSNNEFVEHTLGTISDRTLKRRKGEAREIVVVKHGVKNRSTYYLVKSWFSNFINSLLIKLGIQPGQNGRSHIISIDTNPNPSSTLQSHMDFETLNEYDNLKKATLAKPTKPSKPTKLSTRLTKQHSDLEHEQRRVYDTLMGFGIVAPLVLGFLQKLTLAQIYNKIEAAKLKGISPQKMGAYLRASLQNIERDNLPRLATSGNIPKTTTEDSEMGRPTAPGPTELQTQQLLHRLEVVQKSSKPEAARRIAELKKQLRGSSK